MAGKRLGDAGATFSDLWSSYDTGKPCNGPFSNQCAIRLSEALLQAEVSLSGFGGARCWSDDSENGGKHIIRAEEFGNWLARGSLPGLGATQKVDPKTYQTELNGKTGIIFFKDYWQRSGETFENRSGDHIDLWNKNRTSDYAFGWTRDFWEWALSSTSDRNDSREVWFWSVP